MNEVLFSSDFEFIVQQFFQHLKSYILVLKPFEFCKKLFGENGDIRLFDSGGIKNIYYFFGDQRLVDDLENGGFDILVAVAVTGAVKFGETCLYCLKKADFVFNAHRLLMRNCNGKAL